MGPFITPPPTTDCIVVQTDKLLTQAKGGFVNLSIANGATCDYIRVEYVIDETDVSKQITESEGTFSATNIPIEKTFLAHAYGTAFVQVEGRHSRVSMSSGTSEAAWDEEDPEDCEFWNSQCNDVDCIFEGNHCRGQCAIAEVEEEPQPRASTPQALTPKAFAFKRGLRFRRSAP